tara:strand:- start:92 stop:808 length:717 start_codon:yes stop_codon:yes gene_type:complete
MAKPEILNIGTDSTYYTTKASRTESTYTVTAPASANTVIFVAGFDDITDGTDLIPTITWGSRTPSVTIKLMPTNLTDVNYRYIKLLSFDVSSEGAISDTATLTFKASTSLRDVLGVFCTDGYMQSTTLNPERSSFNVYEPIYSGDPDNTGYLMFTCMDASNVTYTAIQGTEIFEASVSDLSAFGIYNSTAVSDIQSIEFSASTANDAAFANVILTNKVNPFAGRGVGAGPVIKHDVIT